jgi:excisionase family DNA binding protein
MSDLLTVGEVAEILRVDCTTVHRWVKQGTLEAVKLPSPSKRQTRRIRRATVDRLFGPSS